MLKKITMVIVIFVIDVYVLVGVHVDVEPRHPHIHAITADGLFIDNGLFYM